jgi:polar amino acid transport system ATP-binding protein
MTDLPIPPAFALVDICGLHKSFGPTEVLKGIDLQVGRKEVVCIIGKSGSGKSTLLRCINGLEAHRCGPVITVGRPGTCSYGNARRPAAAAPAGRHRFSRAYNLFPHLTVPAATSCWRQDSCCVKDRPREDARRRARARSWRRVGLSENLFDRLCRTSSPAASSSGSPSPASLAMDAAW